MTQSPKFENRSPGEAMRSLGVAQNGDPLLRQVARAFQFPEETEMAVHLVSMLNAAIERIAQVHSFSKGMGIAAPQLGIDRAIAIVRTSGGESITLFNPHIVKSFGEIDEQYEGCLSFFDVRGLVPRSTVIHVHHTTVDGDTVSIFERGTARLVAHEVDHLHGHLYLDRMKPGASPISVEQYRDTGTNWKY